MTKKLLMICIILIMGILTSCGNPARNEIGAAGRESGGAAPGSGEESGAAQENGEEYKTVGNTAGIDLDEIASIEVRRRNIEEEKAAILEGAEARNFGEKLIKIKLKEFNKKEFNPLTGGDEVYTVLLKSGESVRIVYNGSFEINGEKYLPEENYQNIDLEVPSRAEWETVTASKASGE